MGNLGKSSTRPNDPRPFQNGRARGTKNGLPVDVPVEWLIDTGANVAAISGGNASQFDLTPLSASASATTGGGGIIMHSGLTTVFDLVDPTTGLTTPVTCSLRVGVKPGNTGSEVLGMDHVKQVNGRVNWDPKAQSGDLET